ncbi:MAG: ubiquinol-cytochrome C chaperone [Mesorhizobium amorphae]|nr:MAG: ubiquinol-cytochrome C chaperone [Mesorhizobium amorphae]
MLDRLFGRKRRVNQAIVASLYAEIVAAARQPTLYRDWLVPDTPLGRFEMIGLHTFLLLGRLQEQGPAARGVAQEVTDTFFADVDQSLRELGIGDMGIPKRVKKLARMFYGRTKSYSDAIAAGDMAALADALARNIRPGQATDSAAGSLAHYVREAVTTLQAQPLDDILAGKVFFPRAEPTQIP